MNNRQRDTTGGFAMHTPLPRPPRQFTSSRVSCVHFDPRETLFEKLTRDLDAWRLAKGVIARAKMRALPDDRA